jgi:hypothetical protein
MTVPYVRPILLNLTGSGRSTAFHANGPLPPSLFCKETVGFGVDSVSARLWVGRAPARTG